MPTIVDDEDNPWRWMGTAKLGQPSEVLMDFGLGIAKADGTFVLCDDGCWYSIDPPHRVPTPLAWRYKMVKGK